VKKGRQSKFAPKDVEGFLLGYDLDDIDEDEVPTAVMRTMAIGDVRP
jgi:hypothetical protein